MLKVEALNTFYGGAHILHDVGLEVPRGQVVALLGRNGAGKSTTMKSIMGVAKARSGKVQFDGKDISGLSAHVICQAGLGYVPEERRIFRDLTILENLEVGRRPKRSDAPSWSIEKLFQLFPNLRERKDNLGAQMSGGEQQMLTIARTLMGNPSMILLDEPSEGIAPIIVEQMARTILEMKREGLTVILSEQNLHFAKVVSDRAIIIESGQIRYQDTMAALEAQPEIREKFLAV